MTSLNLRVHRKNGLHVRLAAAFITTLKSILKDNEVLKSTYIVFREKKVKVNNLLSLVSLKIGKGEEFQLVFEEHVPSHILEEISAFFEEKDQEDSDQAEVDRLMMENSITLQEAIGGLPNGIIVVNRENVITYVNDSAARLLLKEPQELINYRADEVIPQSRLHAVMESGIVEVAKKQRINDTTILTNRSPVIFDGKTIGAVAVFQDISNLEKVSEELKNVQELQQRLHLVLHSVSDLIGLTDQEGKFIYSNEELKVMLRKRKKTADIQSIIGGDTWLSMIENPSPLIKVLPVTTQTKFITKVNPIIINDEFCGTVVTMAPFDEIKVLLQKIDLMEQRTKYLEFELSKHQTLDKAFQTIKGNSKVLIESLSIANKVSKTRSTVLITGESGTGKELVARAIHESSDRKAKAFIRVNCAAIPPNLMESELFGHEKGAFTGAYKIHRGKFELANKGTILLDEIGDLSIDLQAKILRVLQEQEVVRVGGTDTILLDVRVIAATNQNIKMMVDEGKFREDLYYRLNVIPIHLPPLRSRAEDIPYLADYFREEFNWKLGKNINSYEPGFIDHLCKYRWPGNIRELQNVMERVINLTDEDQLTCKDLPHHILYGTNEKRNTPLSTLDLGFSSEILKLEEYEKRIFEHASQMYPSYNQLAKALGITHKTAAVKIRKYGLEHLLGKKYQKI
ncbi:sigma 54-interacting transcriptional regulator [Evansella tamaricis]|uniref:HTH-type transcriptional regulatory protein TyrR n=1 Tax=Evansella tamaricis TaxID=2069301 RepID=A0ABS6JG59_9BACI|nr:sigma 54-interacting transcriptional regulator [Evansella tamaricis]MBU9712633.1 sigma 54-interacting transcriptional regulator [Evansella tamaricis]